MWKSTERKSSCTTLFEVKYGGNVCIREAKVQELQYAAMIMLALALASAQSHADLAHHGAGPVQEPPRPG